MPTILNRVALAALLAAASPVAIDAVQAQDAKIIVVSHGQANDGFWSVVKNGATQAGKDFAVTVEYRAPETFDMVAMGQLIDAAVNQKPAGLVVSIPDGSALGPSIKKAVAAGIPVISMNSGGDVSKGLGALLHVGQDEYDAGKAAGAMLKQMGSKRGICINMEVGNVALDQRCKGYADGLGGPVKVVPSGNDAAEVTAKTKAALDSDKAVDSVLSAGFIAADPTLAGARATGRLDAIKVASFDLAPDFMQAVAKGDAAFGIDQQQYLQGYLPVQFLALNARYGLLPGGNVPSGPNLITKDKAAQVVELAKKGIR